MKSCIVCFTVSQHHWHKFLSNYCTCCCCCWLYFWASRGESSSLLQLLQHTRLLTGCPAGLSSHSQTDKSQTCHSHFPLKNELKQSGLRGGHRTWFCFQDLFEDMQLYLWLPLGMWCRIGMKLCLKTDAAFICQVSNDCCEDKTQISQSLPCLKACMLVENWQGVPLQTPKELWHETIKADFQCSMAITRLIS